MVANSLSALFSNKVTDVMKWWLLAKPDFLALKRI